jgi:hypothetical protein
MDESMLPSIGDTIRRVMALDSSIFLAYVTARDGLWGALWLVALAGISKTVGQSVILFINHVRPLRFGLALLIGVVQYIGGYLLWATSVWLAGAYGFGVLAPWPTVASAVGVAYAPQILAFFELTPFFGNAFGVLLTLWSLLAIVVGVQAGLGLTLGQAVLASGLGWLLLQIWGRTLGRPIHALGRWVEHMVVGAPLQYSWRDLPTLRRKPAWERYRRAQLRNRVRPRGARTPEQGQLSPDATTHAERPAHD